MFSENDNTYRQLALFETLQKIATNKNAQKFMDKIIKQKGDGEKLGEEVELQIQAKLLELINREIKQLTFLINLSQRFKVADNASKINTLINFVNSDIFGQISLYLASLGLKIGADELTDIAQYCLNESLKNVAAGEQLKYLKQFYLVMNVVLELGGYGRSDLKKWLKNPSKNEYALSTLEQVMIYFCKKKFKVHLSAPEQKEIDLLHKNLFNEISSAERKNRNKEGVIHKFVSTSKKISRFLISPFKKRTRERTTHMVQKAERPQKAMLKAHKKSLNNVSTLKSKRSGLIHRLLATKLAKFNLKALACFGFLNLLPLHVIHRPELWFVAAACSFAAVSSAIKPKKIFTKFFRKKNVRTSISTTKNDCDAKMCQMK